MKKNFTYLTTALCWLMSLSAGAQLSSNPDKFLGNITTGYNVDYGSEKAEEETLISAVPIERPTMPSSIIFHLNITHWCGVPSILDG